MRNKRLLRTLSALCLTLVLASGFTVPAFAQGAAPPPAADTTNDSNVVVEETEKAPPLTPDGNAALVDDFGGNKQLITVDTNIIHQRGVALRGQRRCFFRFFHHHIAVIDRKSVV